MEYIGQVKRLNVCYIWYAECIQEKIALEEIMEDMKGVAYG